MQKAVAKISLRTIEENALYFKNRTGAKLCAVVKDDAYGHGAEKVAAALHEIADCFAVSNIDEAAALQSATDKDILILTPPANEAEAKEIALRGCIMSVDSACVACFAASAAAFLNKLSACGNPYGEKSEEKFVRAHIKTNTGMNRFGCDGAAFTRVCELLKNCAGVRVEGIFSHLAGVNRLENAIAQRDLFVKQCTAAENYFGKLTRHLSATAGACLSSDYYFDMVRVGLGLYGYLPEGCLPLAAVKRGRGGKAVSPVRPAMKAYARCIESRTYQSGFIGYGERTGERGERLHAVNAGYGGGFFRKMQNGMNGGENAALPCMDCTIRRGSQPRGKEICVMKNAEETARSAGTIAYEVLCAIGSHAEREYI